MSPRLRLLLAHGAAVALGLPLGFFFAFNLVFTDRPEGLAAEVLLAFAVLAAAYFVSAFLISYAFAVGPKTIPLALAAGAIIVLVLYSQREPQQTGFHVLVLTVVLAAAFAGVFLAPWLRLRRLARTPPS